MQRNTNIELFRLILMITIFIWHILVHGYGLKFIGTSDFTYTGNVLLPLIIGILCVPSTYAFMFISGYYGITYSHKRLGYILFSLYAVVLCTTVVKLAIGRFSANDILLFLPLSKRQWWFITWYVVILLLSPIINKGIEFLTKRQFRFLILAMSILLSLSMITLQPNGGSNLFGLLTMYLLGRYFSIYNVQMSQTTAICLFIGGAFLFAYIVGKMLSIAPIAKYSFVFLGGYNNPLTITMAIALCYIVFNIKPVCYPTINRLLSPVLFIYLITESFNPYLYGYIANNSLSAIYMGGVIVISLITGHVTNWLYNKIWPYFERKIIATNR